MAKSFAVQGPPFDLRLSEWDKRFTPFYSKRLLCFALPDNRKETHERITKILLEALQATVEELPFLAGSVVPLSKKAPWLRDLRSQGAAYLETIDLSQELSFSDLRNASFSSSLLNAEKLCALPASIYVQDDPVDVCRLRANFVDGGFILACQIMHVVCDGRGITDVLKVLADNCVKIQAGEPPKPRTDHYSFDRNTILSGNGAHGAIENHPCWTISPIHRLTGFGITKTICTNFHISSDSLRALKEIAASRDQRPIPSTHDAVSILIRRSVMLARQRAGIISSDAIISFAMPIDGRRILDLPRPYFGNAIYGIRMYLPFSELAKPTTGLQLAARMLRTEINDTTAEKFRDLLGFVERTNMESLTRMSVVEDLTKSTMFLTSYFGFEMHALDFGEAFGGRIEAFRLPAGGLVPGCSVVLPRLPDGSCEFVVNEREDVMVFLGRDEDFVKFVGKQY